MVKYQYIYENLSKTIRLSQIKDKQVDMYGVKELPPKLLTITVGTEKVMLHLVETIILTK